MRWVDFLKDGENNEDKQADLLLGTRFRGYHDKSLYLLDKQALAFD